MDRTLIRRPAVPRSLLARGPPVPAKPWEKPSATGPTDNKVFRIFTPTGMQGSFLFARGTRLTSYPLVSTIDRGLRNHINGMHVISPKRAADSRRRCSSLAPGR
jgi:hypothetical protein